MNRIPVWVFLFRFFPIFFPYEKSFSSPNIIFGRLSPKYKDAKYKMKNYACGEDFPSGQKQQSHNLFRVAFFFTVLHVDALIIATAPISIWAFLGVVLIGSMSITAYALYIEGEKHV